MSASATNEPDVSEIDAALEASAVTRKVEEVVDEVGADVILAEIRRNCFILYVTVRSWRGHYLMRNSQTLVDGKPVDKKLATASQWKVMPEKWHKALQPFESQCRSAVYRVGVAFKDGVYIVPKGRAKALVDEIKRIRTAYMAKVAEFQEEWPRLVEELETKITSELGDLHWMAVSKLLPDARNFHKLFDIEIGLWPVSSGGLPVECFDSLEQAAVQLDAIDRLADEMAGEDANLLSSFVTHVRETWEKAKRGTGKVIEENAETWLSEAQSVTNRMIASAVKSMIHEPIQEFAEQIDNLIKVADAGTARNQTLDLVRRAYGKLRGFSFLLPDDLLQRLRQIDLRLGAVDAQAVNVNSRSVAGANLAASLRAIREELTSDVNQLNAFGQFTRHLDI